jgi:hypothetical protein
LLTRTQPAVNQPMWRGSADASGAACSLCKTYFSCGPGRTSGTNRTSARVWCS